MVINKEHPNSCLKNLSELRHENSLCDVTIEADGLSFPVHKVVLSSCSPYFKAMFCGDMEESKMSRVAIKKISSEAMDIILDYCYTGEIEITEYNVQDLLPAASLLQLEFVRESCCEFLKHQLCSTNCLGVLSFAHTHDCRDLKDAAHNYAKHHYLDILESEEFLDQNAEDLVDLLQSEELNIRNESQVYDSVIRWVKHDLANRKDRLHELLEHVRLPLIEAEYLVSCISCEPLIRQNELCRDLVDEAKNYLLLPDQRFRHKGPRTRPRKHIKPNEVLYAVGGWCNGDAINMVEKYNVNSNEWQQVACMNKRRCGVGIAVLNNFIFAIGGHDGGSYLNSVERYDPITDVWSCSVSPTSTCRTSVGVVVLNDKIYAVGGQDGISCLNIVECYDPERNRWSQVAPMNTQRLGVAVGVINGQLYAVGGSDGTSPVNTVERYDPRENRWTYIPPMQVKRKHLGVAVHENCIYAVGGRDECFELSSVEKYDPTAGYWHSMIAMNERRSGLGLCVFNDKLYSVGGFNGSSYLKTVEYFDCSDHQWNSAQSMNYRRLGCGIGVLNATS